MRETYKSLQDQKIIKTIDISVLIKKIKEYLPLLYLLLICFTIITKAFFYSQYNIDIYSYLDITEYLIYFFKDLYSLFIPLIISYILAKPIVEGVYFFRFATKSYKTKPITFIRAGFLVNYLICSLILYLINSPWYVYFGVVLGTRIWYLYNVNKRRENPQTKEGFVKSDLIEIFISIVFLSISTVYLTSYRNIENNKISKINLLNGKTIKFKSSTKVVGETYKYIFIYNTKNKESITINRDKIEFVVYKK